MKTIAVYLTVLFPAICCAQTSLHTTTLLDGRVVMELPVILKMDSVLHNKLSPQHRVSEFLMADASGTITLRIDSAAGTVTDNDIPGYADVIIEAVRSNRPDVKVTDDGISLNGGKNIGFIKYIAPEGEDKGYNCIFYGSCNGKMTVFIFNCPIEESGKWIKTIDRMISTLRLYDQPK